MKQVGNRMAPPGRTTMRIASLLVAGSVLLGWTSAGEARRLPDRAQVERAVNAWFVCAAGAECGQPFRRRLTQSRCLRLPPDNGIPGRILCMFSGSTLAGARRPAAFGTTASI